MKKKVSSIVLLSIGIFTLLVGCVHVGLTYNKSGGDGYMPGEFMFIFLYAYIIIALMFFIAALVLLCLAVSKDKKNTISDENKKSEISQNHQ